MATCRNMNQFYETGGFSPLIELKFSNFYAKIDLQIILKSTNIRRAALIMIFKTSIAHIWQFHPKKNLKKFNEGNHGFPTRMVRIK